MPQNRLPALQKQDETRLTVPERVFLGSHLLICPHCREYKKQLDLIQKAMKKMF